MLLIDDDAKIISMLLSDIGSIKRCRHLLKRQYFEPKLRSVLDFLTKHWDDYGELPPRDLLDIPDGYTINNDIQNLNEDFCVERVTAFIEHRAWTHMLREGVECLERQDYATLGQHITKAQGISDKLDDWGAIWGDQIGCIDPPVYLIHPLIVKDTVTGIYGTPGSFKSFLALDIALTIATGSCGLEKQPICYIAAEGEAGINLRTEAWCQHYGKTLARNDLLMITKPLVVTDNSSVSKFIAYIKNVEIQNKIDYALFVVDTLSQCMPGADENAAKDVSIATSNLIRIRRELKTTVVFIHHTGKDATKEMRGSSVIKANTDAMIEITRNEMSGVASVKRQKDAPTGANILFDLLPVAITRLTGTELGGSLVCQQSGTGLIAKTPLMAMRVKLLLREMAAAIGIGNELSTRQVIIAMGKSDGVHYKKQIAEVTPLGEEVAVDLADGSHVKLKRSAGSGYGDIKCWK